MRVVHMLVAAVGLGLAAGYAWSAMVPAKTHVHVPRPSKAAEIIIPDSEADQEWQARAEDEERAPNSSGTASQRGQEGDVRYGNCAEARAAGKAPIHMGEPGYSSNLDADGDGVACEPYSGN